MGAGGVKKLPGGSILTRFAPLATIVAKVYHCHFPLTIKNLKGTDATFFTYMLVDNLDKGFDF